MKMREQNGRVLFPLILSIPAGVQHRPVSDSEPRRPDDQAPPRGDAGQEQPGIEGRPEQKEKDFFSGAVFVSFFVYSNVLHLLCFLFWNKLFAASLNVINDMGPPERVPDWPGTGKIRHAGSIPLSLPTGPNGPTV